MHLGNVAAALISWLSVKSRHGRWIVRMEDLDAGRSRQDYAEAIVDDLVWLGLEPDSGGLDPQYRQSSRHALYEEALGKLRSFGLVYPCMCTRAELHAVGAPHASDGRVIYGGRCRPAGFPAVVPEPADLPHALRLYVPGGVRTVRDMVFGPYRADLAADFGDFVLRRADGAWAYQLAVVVDDADMGVDEVVRGADLLSSALPQNYICELLGYREPVYGHIPVLCNSAGRRLSKRDGDASMEHLRAVCTAEEIIGRLAFLYGLRPDAAPVAAAELAMDFSWHNIPAKECICL